MSRIGAALLGTEKGCGGGNSFQCLPAAPPPFCLPNAMEGGAGGRYTVVEGGERRGIAWHKAVTGPSFLPSEQREGGFGFLSWWWCVCLFFFFYYFVLC